MRNLRIKGSRYEVYEKNGGYFIRDGGKVLQVPKYAIINQPVKAEPVIKRSLRYRIAVWIEDFLWKLI